MQQDRNPSKQPFTHTLIFRLPVQSGLEAAIQVSLVNTTRPPVLSGPKLPFSHEWSLTVALTILTFWYYTRSLKKTKIKIHFVTPKAKPNIN